MAIINIGVITDSHWDDKDTDYNYSGSGEDRYYRDADDKMTDFVADMNSWVASVVIQCGDFINMTGDSDSWDYIDGIFDNLTATRGYCYGNHDNVSLGGASWMTKTGYSDVYHSFDSNGIHFVIVSYISSGGTGSYYNDQQTWLTNDLATNNSGNGYPVLVFGHYTLLADELSGTAEMRAILEADGNVIACFFGHSHLTPSKTTDTGIDYYNIYGNVSGAYSDGDKNSYAKIRFDNSDNSLTVQGFGQQPTYGYTSTSSSTSSTTSTSTSSSTTSTTTTSSSTSTTSTTLSTTTTPHSSVIYGENNVTILSGKKGLIKTGLNNENIISGNNKHTSAGSSNDSVIHGN